MHTARYEKAMQRKNAAKAGESDDPIENIRAHCLARGATGIKGIGRSFKIMDDDGSRSLNLYEFTKGLNDYGVFLDDKQAYQDCYDRFDSNGDGSIDFDEFLKALRPPMSKARVTLIRKAFTKLDKTGDGEVTPEDLKDTFDPTHHPKYKNGEWEAEQVFKEFLKVFETPGDADGVVTWEEFLNYYSGVSASIDGDAYFDLMMRTAYKL
jgi:Ca2+-binding EF-hand superfamily protein